MARDIVERLKETEIMLPRSGFVSVGREAREARDEITALRARLEAVEKELDDARKLQAKDFELLDSPWKQRAERAEARAYTLAVAIMGGEDAPGYADSIDADALTDQLRKERLRNQEWTDACVKVAVERAETKLVKAVEALETIVDNGGAGSYHLARTTLAELKGQDDE